MPSALHLSRFAFLLGLHVAGAAYPQALETPAQQLLSADLPAPPDLRGKLKTELPPLPQVTVVSRTERTFQSSQTARLDLSNARLVVPAGAWRSGQQITLGLERISSASLPPLPPGLVNVTEGGGGYRFLPEGQQFGKDVDIALPLRTLQSTTAWKTLRPQIFYYDKKQRSWNPLPGAALEEDGRRVAAKARHFTLMISGVLQAPDHAGPANFNENAISGIGAADPKASVDLIAPPEPSSFGDAQTSFPLRLPTGRGGYSPQLSLVYSSANGNGPLGVGWDLPVPRITVDTRLGVPGFDDSDRYLLDGNALIPVARGEGTTCLRKRPQAQGAGAEVQKEFVGRVHRFQRVAMCKVGKEVYWEVVSRDGVRFYYGVDNASRIHDPRSTNKVAAWLLAEVEDPNLNLTRYAYTDVRAQKYLADIAYTSHLSPGQRAEDLPPAYRVALGWGCGSRDDQSISARFGFLLPTECRLSSVKVTATPDQNAKPVQVRRYDLSYDESTFDGRSLLGSITVRGADDGEFYRHSFSYTGPEYDIAGPSSGPTCDAVGPFCKPVTLPVDSGNPSGVLASSKTLVDSTDEESHSGSISVGVSADWGVVGCSATGSLGAALDSLSPKVRFMDVNGDGYLDRVWQTSSGIRVALGSAAGWSTQAGDTSDSSRLEWQGGFGINTGGDGSCAVGNANATLGFSAGTGVSLRLATSTAMLVDMDGDGIPDLLSGRSYRRGLPRGCRNPADVCNPLDSATCKCEADGLTVCKAESKVLCFARDAELTSLLEDEGSQVVARGFSGHQMAKGTWVADASSAVTAAGRSVTDAGSATTAAKNEQCKELTIEDSWGGNTAVRRRLEAEQGGTPRRVKEDTQGTLASPASIDPVRQVWRWDARYTGTVRVDAKFRRPYCGGRDGLRIRLVKVKDFFSERDNVDLGQLDLGPKDPSWVTLKTGDLIDLAFNESLIFVIDPLVDVPVSVDGTFIDQVIPDIAIDYVRVCPRGSECRAVSDKDQDTIHTETGELAYRFRLPSDFSVAELPRETYWRLLPPVATSPTRVEAYVELEVDKKLQTPGRVDVRVRCESAASQKRGDNPNCSLGDILAMHLLEPNEGGKSKWTVRVPAPFIEAQNESNQEAECSPFERAAFPAKEGEAFYVTDGTKQTGLFASAQDAAKGATLARIGPYCTLGGIAQHPAGSKHRFFWLKTADLAGIPEGISQDCVDYKPWNLTLKDLPDGKAALVADRMRLMVFDSRSAAANAKPLVQRYSRICYVGRANPYDATDAHGGNHRDFVYAYFSRVPGSFDPLRLMVEVEGEGGYDIDPAAIAVTATLHFRGLFDLEPVEKWQGQSRLMRTGEPKAVNGERGVSASLPVLYRVHPSRDLQAFTVHTSGASLHIGSVLANVDARQNAGKRPLYLALFKDGVASPVWSSIPLTQAAGQNPYVKEETRTLEAGLYTLRSYVEATFDPTTVVNVKARLQEKGASVPYLLLVGKKYPNPKTTYAELNQPAADIAVFQDTDTEWVARRKFPQAKIIAVSSFDPLTSLASLLPDAQRLPGGAIRVPQGNGSHLDIAPAELLVWLVSQEKVSATLVRKAMAGGAPPRANVWFCCQNVDIVVTDNNKIDVPSNLFTADFGYSILVPGRLDRLFCEVSQSFDPYTGGRRGFFRGLFSGKGPIKCFAPWGCGNEPPRPIRAAASRQEELPGMPRRSSLWTVASSERAVIADAVPFDDVAEWPGVRASEAAAAEPLSQVAANDKDKAGTGTPPGPDAGSAWKDSDGDGIPDAKDKCPGEVEDFRGDRADGCPEKPAPDTDDDGVPDSEDMCPYVAWQFSGLQPGKSKGCPDPVEPPALPPTGGPPGAGGPGWAAGSASEDIGGSASGGAGPFSLDGIRRTWVFGLSASLGANVSYGVAGGGLSGSINFGAQYTDRDIMDWNGDGLVDFVSPSRVDLSHRGRSIEVSNQGCWLEIAGHCLIRPGVAEALSASTGVTSSVGVGGGSGSTRREIKTTPDGEVKAQTDQTRGGRASTNLNWTDSYHLNRSAALSRRMDLNGDGLPDQVYANPDHSLRVRFNLGDSLSDEKTFRRQPPTPSGGLKEKVLDKIAEIAGTRPIAVTDSATHANGLGGSVGAEFSGFGGSVSGSKTKSLTVTGADHEFADVNGDGLPDLVIKSPGSNAIQVAFNLGQSFGKYRDLSPGTGIPEWRRKINASQLREGLKHGTEIVPDGFDPLTASGSDTTTWSGEVCATVFFVKSCFSYQHSEGLSTTQGLFTDVDGDGIPDRVLRTSADPSGSIQVERGLTGGANLLRQIVRPLGGVIDLQYRLGTPTERSPRAKWELSRVSVGPRANYPEAATGVVMTTDITYEDPYYDRYEKEHFGYRTVELVRSVDGRRTRRTYENTDFWLKGSLLQEQVLDGDGKLFLDSKWEYMSRPHSATDSGLRSACLAALIPPQKYLDNDRLKGLQRTPCDAREPLPLASENAYIEGGRDRVVFRQSFARPSGGGAVAMYDAYGNPTWLKEEHGAASNPLLYAAIEYELKPEFLSQHIVDRVKRIIVRGDREDGPVLRQRQAMKSVAGGSNETGYDSRGNLVHYEVVASPSADPAGTARHDLIVDEFGFVTQIDDKNGQKIEFTPDPVTHALRIKIKDGFGLETNVKHDYRFQQPLQTVDPNETLIEKKFDEHGRLIAVIAPNERAASQATISVKYDDPRFLQAGPALATTTNHAEPPPNLVPPQRPTLQTIARYVDWNGRDIQTRSSTVIQTGAGQPAVFGTAVSGRVAYDGAGRIVMKSPPAFAPGSLDAFAAVDPERCEGSEAQSCTFVTFDVLDRPVRIVAPGNPGNEVQEFAYGISRLATSGGSVLSRLTTIEDAADKTKFAYHDALDRLVALEYKTGGPRNATYYTYSAVGDLLSIVDAKWGQRTYEYDLAGRRTVVTTPDTGRIEMVYDPMGNLIKRADSQLCNVKPPLLKDGACKPIVQAYYKNRLIEIVYPNDTGPNGTQKVVFTYGDQDPDKKCAKLKGTKGRVCHIQDLAGSELRSYGALGEVVEQSRTLSTVADDDLAKKTYTMGFAYDSFGRIRQVGYPDGSMLSYTYDASGQVSQVRDPADTYVKERGYDVYGKPLFTTYGNDVVEANRYDKFTERLSQRTVYHEPTGVLHYSLDLSLYDKVGNIIRSSTQRGPGHDVGSIDRIYTYDDLHRLKTFDIVGTDLTGASSFGVSGGYDYDPVGNITKQAVNGSGSAASWARDWTYKYDAKHPNQPTEIGPMSGILHDRRGAITSLGDYKLYWNDEGRLKSAEKVGRRGSAYRYSADGDRMWMQVGSGSDRELFLYPNPYLTVRKCYGAGAPGAVTACADGSVITTKFVRVDGQNVAAISTSAPSTTSTVYLHTDQVGSTTAVSGETGTVTQLYDYLPNGEVLAQESTPESGGETYRAFQSKPADQASDLVNFGARYYLPLVGRWLSPDPKYLIRPDDGLREPQQLNLFAFGGNNPIRFIDRDGYAERDANTNVYGSCDLNGCTGFNPSNKVTTLDLVGARIVGKLPPPSPPPGIRYEGEASFPDERYIIDPRSGEPMLRLDIPVPRADTISTYHGPPIGTLPYIDPDDVRPNALTFSKNEALMEMQTMTNINSNPLSAVLTIGKQPGKDMNQASIKGAIAFKILGAGAAVGKPAYEPRPTRLINEIQIRPPD